MTALSVPGIASLLVCILGVGRDGTPLLTPVSPLLNLLTGLLGLGAGIWSAARLTTREKPAPFPKGKRRWLIRLGVPFFTCAVLVLTGQRIFELAAFGRGGQVSPVILKILDKDAKRGRRGPIRYTINVRSPHDGQPVSFRVGQDIYEAVEPGRHCAAMRIERAANGASRLRGPIGWTSPCPPEW